MKGIAGLIVIAASLLPAPAVAQAGAPPPPAIASEHRLSPEEVESVLADAAKKRQAVEQQPGPDVTEKEPRTPVHGEVGLTIGNGGHREVFGTGIYPLGDDGVAAISLDYVDLGKRRFKR